MDAHEEELLEDGSVTFSAGNYVFTHAEALECSRLNRGGTTVWQLKEQRHTEATLEQIVVAIQVGIMALSFTIEQIRALSPHVFDPDNVYLGMWRIGAPSPVPIEE